MYNFEIEQYSKQDLEKLFQISSPYTKAEVLEKKQEFFEKISNAVSAKEQNPKLIQNLTKFLQEAYDLLVYFIKDETTPQPHPQPQPIPLHQSNQRHTPQYVYDTNLPQHYSNTTNSNRTNKFITNDLYDRAKNEIIPPIEKPYQVTMQTILLQMLLLQILKIKIVMKFI